MVGMGSQQLHTWVICNKGKRSLKTKEGTLPPDATKTRKVSCPKSQHVMGGGAAIFDATTDARLNSTYPFDSGDKDKAPDDGWKARGVNLVGSQHAFDVYALCTKRKLTYKQDKLPQGGPGTSGHTVFCPESKHVLSGGVKVTGPGYEAVLHYLRPQDTSADANAVPDDGWLANVGNQSGGLKDVTAFVVCG